MAQRSAEAAAIHRRRLEMGAHRPDNGHVPLMLEFGVAGHHRTLDARPDGGRSTAFVLHRHDGLDFGRVHQAVDICGAAGHAVRRPGVGFDPQVGRDDVLVEEDQGRDGADGVEHVVGVESQRVPVQRQFLEAGQ